jgi:hypothetical protein
MMNTQAEQVEDKKEENKPNSSVQELSRQYQEGEISTMDVLMAIRELLVKYN